MLNFKIRQANLEDLNEMQNLFVETVQSVCENDYTSKQIEIWTSGIKNLERWKGIINEQYCAVAKLDGIMVGFCSLKDGNYLDMIYVHKDLLKCGIAHKLYEEIEKEARNLKVDSITSDVSLTALPFFERIGFAIVKKNRVVINGTELINYKMLKRIYYT